MLRTLRERAENEKGFTLIELLVVILIIGILAAIAIPSFINQRHKATDAAAKSAAVTAEEAMETCATDHGGKYDVGCAAADLVAIEPTLDATAGAPNQITVGASGGAAGTCSVGVPGASSYSVCAAANRGTAGATRYKIDHASASTVTRTCVVEAGENKGGCPSGTW